MHIALIGASGQLGTDIQKVISADNLVKLDYPDFEITKPDIRYQISDIGPDMIVNTAAYNLVDRAEQYPEEATAVNWHGVENLVEVCLKLDLPLMHFSTDYVFGQDKNRHKPYTEVDQPGPVNKYGESKLKGEQVIQQKMKKYFIIRTAHLFGTAGSKGKGGNIVEALIKKGKEVGELRVVNDQYTTPTYTLDLTKQVWHLIQSADRLPLTAYGLYHITAGGECSICDFAREIFKLLKHEVKAIPVTTKQYNSLQRDLNDRLPRRRQLQLSPSRDCARINLPADRPRYSVLANKRLKDLGLNIMRPWQEGLKDYLHEKGYI